MSSMQGRVVVVTGATTGIGKESARQLLAKGAEVVVVARDLRKIEETERELRRDVADAVISHVRCDLASLASVREAADTLRTRHERIHVLLNNAGAVHMTRGNSHDGHELTLQTNHLGPFLLTRLLTPALERAATAERKARIVNVASAVHAQGVLDWNDLHRLARYTGMGAYTASKLMNVMTTYELARRLASANVTANCLHPGVIGSGFGHNNTGWMGLGVKLVKPFLKTPAQGARTNVFLSSAPEVEGLTGKYFDDAARERRTSRVSYDEAQQRRLWEVTETLLGLA